MISVGIDAGSRAVKVVLLGSDGRAITRGLAEQGVRSGEIAERLLDRLLERSGLTRADVGSVVATGYARNQVAADSTITEITCHARGVNSAVPEAKTIVEIGGQDSKLLRLDARGNVQDFAMNDRCAAGTGRFLEVVADRLEVGLDDLGELAARSTSPACISSMCIVFAETEIIGLLAAGADPADIVTGVQNSIATRVVAMMGRSVAPPVVFTGGVALIPGMRAALAEAMGAEVAVAPDPQYTGALGAALLASELAPAPAQPV